MRRPPAFPRLVDGERSRTGDCAVRSGDGDWPVTAFLVTTNWMKPEAVTVNGTGFPPTSTDVAPTKREPQMVTTVWGGALEGAKKRIAGGGAALP